MSKVSIVSKLSNLSNVFKVSNVSKVSIVSKVSKVYNVSKMAKISQLSKVSKLSVRQWVCEFLSEFVDYWGAYASKEKYMCFIALPLLESFSQTQNLLKLVVMCGTCNLSSPSSKHSSSSPSTLTSNPATLFTQNVPGNLLCGHDCCSSWTCFLNWIPLIVIVMVTIFLSKMRIWKTL